MNQHIQLLSYSAIAFCKHLGQPKSSERIIWAFAAAAAARFKFLVCFKDSQNDAFMQIREKER